MLSRPLSLVFVMCVLVLGGCSTAPRGKDQAAFLERAESTTRWFESNVNGLSNQIDDSAGYVVFPDVARWGILIGGGTFGRGALCEPNGTQIGWAALNTGSIGLQAGVEGFRMLMVLQDRPTLEKFKDNQLSGSVSGVLVAGDSAASATAPFHDGVAIYQGANQGLMAGVNIGLDVIRYEPLAGGDAR